MQRPLRAIVHIGASICDVTQRRRSEPESIIRILRHDGSPGVGSGDSESMKFTVGKHRTVVTIDASRFAKQFEPSFGFARQSLFVALQIEIQG